MPFCIASCLAIRQYHRMGENTVEVSATTNTAGRRVRWGWLLVGMLLLIAAYVAASSGTCSQGGGEPDCQTYIPLPVPLALAVASAYPFWRAFSRP